MVKRKRPKHRWRKTTCGGIRHQYIMAWEDAELFDRIRLSELREIWRGHPTRIVISRGWKYWICWPVINRKPISTFEANRLRVASEMGRLVEPDLMDSARLFEAMDRRRIGPHEAS